MIADKAGFGEIRCLDGLDGFAPFGPQSNPLDPPPRRVAREKIGERVGRGQSPSSSAGQKSKNSPPDQTPNSRAPSTSRTAPASTSR